MRDLAEKIIIEPGKFNPRMQLMPLGEEQLEDIQENGVTFSLVLTKQCNLKCGHCLMNSGPNCSSQYMGYETLELCSAFINYMKEDLGVDALNVNLIGGEPTLHPKEFARCLDTIKQHMSPAISYSMSTNGHWLFDKKKLWDFAWVSRGLTIGPKNQ